ncbi:MAG: MGDG synthase family glycosyltransferase [Planctomycetota bacterium]|jgi:processive 1,2-diacylglycerol beta-glucosyltransferase
MSAVDAKPLVLVITASVGAGHNATAAALCSSLSDRYPDLAVDVIDDMTLVPGWFRTIYAGGFNLAVARAPRLYGVGFRLSNRPHGLPRNRRERVRLALERHALGRLREILLERQPHLIVHTHFLAPPMVGGLIERGALAGRQVVVATDRELHRLWHAEHVDHWFVASEEARGTLGQWGVDADRVTISGIPVHPKWRARLDRTEILDTWSLPPDRPLILLRGGTTYTTGPVARIVDRLARACPDACVGVLVGRNQRLADDLRKRHSDDTRVRIIPMTDRMPELAHVASLMITKGGGITTAECAAAGLPVVFLPLVPGQEAANGRFFKRHGAAVCPSRWRKIAPIVRELLNDPERLDAMSAAAGQLDRPATETITRAVGQFLDAGV